VRKTIKRSIPGGVMLLVSLALCGHAAAAATASVNALLQDPSTDPAIRSDRIVLDRDGVPAGKVTFHAANQSKDLIHELLVVRPKPGQTQTSLPYDRKKTEVVESRIDVLGEIPDLRPGASGTMTLDLKPGSYILLCNQPGHYKAGMHTTLSVTKSVP
jgi:uncharacterized cupredoxin-like copper-binding protein